MNHPQFYNRSKYHTDLSFTDEPPGKAVYFEQPFDGYALEGRILYNSDDEAPWILSIHGARGDYTKANAVSFGLQQRGHSLLGMALSGHSKAGTLAPEQTTLGKNVREAETFFEHLDPSRSATVVAYSLGGTPALKLLERHADQIDKLILFYPGIYSRYAYDQPFGDPFRQIISQPFSYRQNDTMDLLRAFKGQLLLIKGQYDGLDPQEYGKPAGTSAGQIEIDGRQFYSPIPKEVIDMVYDAVPADRRQFMELPYCDHSIILWLRDHPAEAEQFLDALDEFLRS